MHSELPDLSDLQLPDPATPWSEGRVRRRPDLLCDGYTDAELGALVKGGGIARLQRGAYGRDIGAAQDPYGLARHAMRARAAGLGAPSLAVSHASAAVLERLSLFAVDLDRVHLTRQGRSGGRVSPHRHEHVATLPESDVTRIDGIRVTTVARTLIDLARTLSLRSAVVAADSALHQGLVTADGLAAQLRAARTSRGIPRARRALALVDGRSESPGETLTRLALGSHGMTPPELQLEICDEFGILIGRSDLGYPDAGILVEFDGRVKYQKLLRPGESPLDAILREKRREEALTELGWLVIRVVWSDLRDPRALADRVRRAIADRRKLVAAGALRGSVRMTPAVTVTL